MKETEEVSRITGGSGLSAPRQESLNLSLGWEKEDTGTEADLRGPLQGRSPLIVGRESPEAVPTHFGKGATPLSFLPGPQRRECQKFNERSRWVGADGGFLHDHSPIHPPLHQPTGPTP